MGKQEVYDVLDGKRMMVTSTAENGVVNRETIFHFEQAGSVVRASYSGGKILEGQLVGRLEGCDLRFAYCQLRDTGELDHGFSNCTVSQDSHSGQIQIEERFEMTVGDRVDIGVNIFSEMKT